MKLGSDGNASLSLYNDAPASPRDVALALKTLRDSFPKAEDGVFRVLSTAVVEDGMTAEQLADAVRHLVRNHRYATFTPADILSFDSRVPLYTYREVLRLVDRDEARFEDFHVVRVKGETFRIKKSDAARYNLDISRFK